MSGRVTIEYDACVVVEKEGDRLSDLNCFWMASDPKHPDNIWKREKWRSGIFLNCYSLQLYYMGYGGNYNSTTRFRRYDGNEAGITDPKVRPAILKEYTDTEHLLKANHWYHIKITNENEGRFIRADFGDLSVVSVYHPPGTRDHLCCCRGYPEHPERKRPGTQDKPEISQSAV